MLSRHRLTLALAFAISFAFAIPGTTSAQTTAPAVPTLTPTPACEKPGEPPGAGQSSELGKSAAEMKRSNWIKNMKTYLECLRTFISDQQAASAPHVRAANTAIEDFNKSVKVLNEQIEAAQPK